MGEREQITCEAVTAGRCESCGRLHLFGWKGETLVVSLALSAQDWAELLLQDDEFAVAAAKRLRPH